jgi:hypothetical protein
MGDADGDRTSDEAAIWSAQDLARILSAHDVGHDVKE